MLRNQTRGVLLARQLFHAETFWARFAGLMGRKRFPGNCDAMLFEKCNSIHCFFMFMEIDVLFTDKEYKVIKCVHALKPWRLAFGGRKSCHCIELPAHTLAQSSTEPGDQLLLDN